jgi:ABC-type branched-subunit amino acid transport system substrate-binding protein
MRRARLTVVAAGLLALASASRERTLELHPSHHPAPQCEPLSAQAARGRAIYRKGMTVGGEPIVGALSGADVTLSGRDAACASCHAQAGAGTEEGGVAAPPITPEALFAPAGAGRQERGAYTTEALAAAIREGRTPLPRQLGPSMPRFRLEPTEMDDLLAYLRCLGHDRDPGVSEDEIRLGAALPLVGPGGGLGASVRAVLSAYFEDVNAQGGVFGRRLALSVEDSAQGPAGERAALERLSRAGIFALVGSVWSGAPEVEASLRAEELPLVGPVAAGRAAAGGDLVFHVHPGPEVLARVAVKYLADERAEGRVWLVHARDAEGERWAEGARVEAARRGVSLAGAMVFAPGGFEPGLLREAVRGGGEAAILFSGSARELVAAARAMERQKAVHIYAPASLMAGLEEESEAVARVVLFLYPGLVGEGPMRALEGFTAFLRDHGMTARDMGEKVSAYVAARLVVEALKRAGASPTRSGLVAALEGLHDFESGLVPALSYGKNRRVGVMGARLVRVGEPRGRITAISDWIEVTP